MALKSESTYAFLLVKMLTKNCQKDKCFMRKYDKKTVEYEITVQSL